MIVVKTSNIMLLQHISKSYFDWSILVKYPFAKKAYFVLKGILFGGYFDILLGFQDRFLVF